MKSNSFWQFLRLLLASFFRWWWAVVTGVASILSYMSLPSGVSIGRLSASVAVLCLSVLLFITVTVIHQGWKLYKEHWFQFRVLRWQRSNHCGGEYVFLVEDRGLGSIGRVAELRRFVDDVEVAFGLIEFVGRDSNMRLQAREVWLEPAHIRDSRTGALPVGDIIVQYPITFRSVEQYAIVREASR